MLGHLHLERVEPRVRRIEFLRNERELLDEGVQLGVRLGVGRSLLNGAQGVVAYLDHFLDDLGLELLAQVVGRLKPQVVEARVVANGLDYAGCEHASAAR